MPLCRSYEPLSRCAKRFAVRQPEKNDLHSIDHVAEWELYDLHELAVLHD